jgi:hypothetical protein
MKYYTVFKAALLVTVALSLSAQGRTPCLAGETLKSQESNAQNTFESQKESLPVDELNKQEGRSPFQPSSLMQEYAVWGDYAPEGGSDWYTKGIPKITARGFIETDQGPRLALIDIEGEGVYVVRKGDKISLQKGVNTLSFHIQEIKDSEVLIKIMPFDRVLPIR